MSIINRKDLATLNDEALKNLSHENLLVLSKSLLATAKTLSDRLNKNSDNSSLPPSSDYGNHSKNNKGLKSNKDKKNGINQEEQNFIIIKKERKKRSIGYGRTQKLPITVEYDYKPETCEHCKMLLNGSVSKKYTSYYQIDLEEITDCIGGHRVINAKYNLFKTKCSCGKWTKYTINQYATEFNHIKLSKWRLLGSKLASVIAYLSKEQRCSLRNIKKMLFILYNIELSVGTINTCIHEIGVAITPITEQLKDELEQAKYMNVDETPWYEKHKQKYLWVFIAAKICLYKIGSRAKETASPILDNFIGNFMSDGYGVYRNYQNRFRCWAHLKRKAKGLNESNWVDGKIFGEKVLNLMDKLIKDIYLARCDNLANTIRELNQLELINFHEQCQQYTNSKHKETSDLAKEFLNDWNAIFRILDYPNYQLTNNNAERALRHWVIVRKLTQGTRSLNGSKVLTNLASFFTTCKLRKLDFLKILTQVCILSKNGDSIRNLLTDANTS